MNINRNQPSYLMRFKVTRRGRKLQTFDDQRIVPALSKDIPERTWMDILSKEETDILLFELREEILEMAMDEVFVRYMEKQEVLFHAFCAMEAWLKIIDWNFYRHDPGEEATAYPPCYIPKREESWIPDELPDMSPKDTMAIEQLNIVEDCSEDTVKRVESSDSIEIPFIEEIPKEYWFPGKVQLLVDETDEKVQRTISYDGSGSSDSFDNMANESEVLQKVTDYGMEQESLTSTKGRRESVDGFMHGAGDSVIKTRRKSRAASRISMVVRNKVGMTRLDDSWSKISNISDCRVRNPKLDVHYEISSEKLNTSVSELTKKK